MEDPRIISPQFNSPKMPYYNVLVNIPCIRYADDIVLLAKSERAAERLLESSTKYLEETLKLKVNREKSRTVSVFAI